jgi:hypothetical protein
MAAGVNLKMREEKPLGKKTLIIMDILFRNLHANIIILGNGSNHGSFFSAFGKIKSMPYIITILSLCKKNISRATELVVSLENLRHVKAHPPKQTNSRESSVLQKYGLAAEIR